MRKQTVIMIIIIIIIIIICFLFVVPVDMSSGSIEEWLPSTECNGNLSNTESALSRANRSQPHASMRT
jgi:peptidoglycan hydrolase CwlO-like protein